MKYFRKYLLIAKYLIKPAITAGFLFIVTGYAVIDFTKFKNQLEHASNYNLFSSDMSVIVFFQALSLMLSGFLVYYVFALNSMLHEDAIKKIRLSLKTYNKNLKSDIK